MKKILLLLPLVMAPLFARSHETALPPDCATGDDAAVAVETPVASPRRKSGDFNGVRFQNYWYIGGFGMWDRGALSLETSLGIRLWKYAYLGIEANLYYMFTPSPEELYMHSDILTGAVVRVYIPAGKRIYPYIDGSGGFSFPVIATAGIGLYFRVGAGVDIGRISVGAGFAALWETPVNAVYLQVGVRIGKY